MILEISVAVMAVAIVVLVIFAVRFLIKITQTIETVQTTLNEVKGQVTATIDETHLTVKETRGLVEEVRKKTEKTESLFHALDEWGKTMEQISVRVDQQIKAHQSRYGNLISVIGTGIELAKRWKQDRKTDQSKGVKIRGEV